MDILIGCEESGIVTKAFRDRGLSAYSCDLLPTRGNPDWHIQSDIKEIVRSRFWHLIILHPPCTALAVSGNRWYGKGMPRNHEREKSILWTTQLWNQAKLHSHHCALENPVSVIFKHLHCDTVQYIQPWQFGHGETKRTGFALHRLPELQPTDVVDGREERVWKMAPGKNRKRDRSTTYQGVANAIADQWGGLLR